MNSKNNIPIVVTMFVVGALFGMGFWAIIGGGNNLAVNDSQEIDTKHEALKQAVLRQYPEYLNGGIEGSYSGTVEEVREGSIVIKRYVPETLLLASDIQETIEIAVDENTKIVKSIAKDEAAYAIELAEYEVAFAEYQRQAAAISEDRAGELSLDIIDEPFYPNPVRQQKMALNEISVGDTASVSTQQDEFIDGQDGPLITTIVIQEGINIETEEGVGVAEDIPFDDTTVDPSLGGT